MMRDYKGLVSRLHERIAVTLAGSSLQEDLLEAADAIKELLSLQSVWTSVNEEFPKKDGVYLTCYKFYESGNSYVSTLSYYAAEQRFQHEGYRGLTVTHWMPRPKPPEDNA